MKRQRAALKSTILRKTGSMEALKENFQKNSGSYLLASKPYEKLISKDELNSRETGGSISSGPRADGMMKLSGQGLSATPWSTKMKALFGLLTTKQVKSSETK